MSRVPWPSETQRCQRLALLGLGDFHADEGLHAGRFEPVGARHIRNSARDNDLGRLAACVIDDHPHGMLKPLGREGRIDAAFKAVTGIGMDLELAPRGRDLDRIPISAFDENVDRLFGAARHLAAHDASDAFHAGLVGNGDHTRFKGVFLVVERDDLFPALGAVHPQVALDLVLRWQQPSRFAWLWRRRTIRNPSGGAHARR